MNNTNPKYCYHTLSNYGYRHQYDYCNDYVIYDCEGVKEEVTELL